MFDFSLFFNAFLIDFGLSNGTLKSSKIYLGRPKAPQGRQKPPRGLQGAILKPLGGPQEPFLNLLGTNFGP